MFDLIEGWLQEETKLTKFRTTGREISCYSGAMVYFHGLLESCRMESTWRRTNASSHLSRELQAGAARSWGWCWRPADRNVCSAWGSSPSIHLVGDRPDQTRWGGAHCSNVPTFRRPAYETTPLVPPSPWSSITTITATITSWLHDYDCTLGCWIVLKFV